jgi:hypothetical protein
MKFFLILLFISSVAHGAVTVQATVDRNAMDPGDTFELRVAVNSDEEDSPSISQAPDVAGFELVNQGMSTSARAGISDGVYKRTTQTVYNYFYQALSIGRFKINSIEIKVGDKAYRTSPIEIQVAKGASGSAKHLGQSRSSRGSNRAPQPQQNGQQQQPWQGDQQDDVEDLFNQLLQRHGLRPGPNGGFRTEPVNPQDAFFIQVEVDKADVFAGEQITAAWYLYTKGVIRDLDTLKYPDLKSFWKEDIEISTNLNFTQEIINGVPYRKALLVSYALFPIKEGEALIDGYKAKCSVLANDMFGFGAGKAYTYTKISRDVKINVRPVPTEGRPSDYSGAVGNFQVTSKIDEGAILTNQPFSFHIRFEGKGNAKLIDLPPFEMPAGLELYDTQKESKFFKNGNSFKDFNLLIIPRQEGDFVVPAVTVSIFDPLKKAYVSKKTEPIKIHVGRGTQDPNIKNSPLFQAKNAEVAQPDFKPIYEATYKASHQPNYKLEAIIYFFMLAAILAGLGLKGRAEMGWREKKRDLLRQMRWRFKRIKSNLSKSSAREIAVEATNALYFILGQLSEEGGATQEIEKLILLISPSVRSELGGELTQKIEQLQMLSFAPDSVTEKMREPEQVKNLIKDIERILEKAVSLSLSDSPANLNRAVPKVKESNREV